MTEEQRKQIEEARCEKCGEYLISTCENCDRHGCPNCETGWIFPEERMPDQISFVLAWTTISREPTIIYYVGRHERDWMYFSVNDNFWVEDQPHIKLIAWRPLPKPTKEVLIRMGCDPAHIKSEHYKNEAPLPSDREKQLEEALREIIKYCELYDNYSNGEDHHEINLVDSIKDAETLLKEQ